MCDIPSDFPHPISHTLLRVCVCHIEDLCHTRLSPLSPALYVFPEVRGRHLQVCIHMRMSHRGSMSHTPITLISRARCHVQKVCIHMCMSRRVCMSHSECVCLITSRRVCMSHSKHIPPSFLALCHTCMCILALRHIDILALRHIGIFLALCHLCM